MAIIDVLPGIEVTVTVNGKAIREYADNELSEDNRTVRRYVEAVSGTVFEVNLQRHSNFVMKGDCLRFQIYVDGVDVGGEFMKMHNHIRTSKGKMTNNGTHVRAYRFATLVSDANIKNGDVSIVKDLGTIKIVAAHHHLGAFTDVSTKDDLLTPGTLSEKALKGRTISHNVEFMAETKLRSPITKYQKSYPVLGETNPAATFVFHYRSLAALKSMRIIPRTPTPPPIEDRDIATLNPGELKEYERRFREMRDQQESRANIKRERTRDEPKARKRARPNATSTQLEIDDDGSVRESSTPTVVQEDSEIVVLD